MVFTLKAKSDIVTSFRTFVWRCVFSVWTFLHFNRILRLYRFRYSVVFLSMPSRCPCCIKVGWISQEGKLSLTGNVKVAQQVDVRIDHILFFHFSQCPPAETHVTHWGHNNTMANIMVELSMRQVYMFMLSFWNTDITGSNWQIILYNHQTSRFS